MTSDDGVRVHVNAEVASLTRANILGHIAREIFSVFDPGSRILDTVLLGVRFSLLQQVELILYDESRKIVGYLSIRIDWDKYAMHLETGGKNVFPLDPAQPVTQQLSPLLAEASAYISEVRNRLNVQSSAAIYTFRPGKTDEGNKRLGTSPIQGNIIKDRASAQAGRTLKVTDSTFSELSVEFRYPNIGDQPDQSV